MIYHHEDDTPVWICLGNGDLVIDEGNKNVDLTANPGQKTRPKDGIHSLYVYTGATLQRFIRHNNEAFWISIQSRSPKTLPQILIP